MTRPACRPTTIVGCPSDPGLRRCPSRPGAALQRAGRLDGAGTHRRATGAARARLVEMTEALAGRTYGSPDERIADLRLMQESMRRHGAGRVAAGEDEVCVWQVETFGFRLGLARGSAARQRPHLRPRGHAPRRRGAGGDLESLGGDAGRSARHAARPARDRRGLRPRGRSHRSSSASRGGRRTRSASWSWPARRSPRPHRLGGWTSCPSRPATSSKVPTPSSTACSVTPPTANTSRAAGSGGRSCSATGFPTRSSWLPVGRMEPTSGAGGPRGRGAAARRGGVRALFHGR